ncbi:MAG: phosphatase PAP2 family protein [Candidatus Latescibacterota bacterium]
MPPHLVSRRTLAILAWITCFTVYSLWVGLPTKRGNVLIWVSLAVFAFGVDHPRSTIRSFVTTWLPLFLALGTYDLLRGVSDGQESDAHTWPHLNLDLWLGGGRTPSELLQRWLWTPGTPHWWDYLAWAVYQSHFFTGLLVAVVLWSHGHRRAAPYIVGIAALSWAALATYWLYPAQPPWMTARDGLTGPVTRIVHEMWSHVGLEKAARVFSTERAGSSRYANPVAALPSLHAAFPMFIAVMLWSRRRRLNLALAAYALAMGTVLVYAGEHFTFDILLGWIYAVTVALITRHLAERRPQVLTALFHRPDPAPSDEAADGGGASGAEAAPVAALAANHVPMR